VRGKSNATKTLPRLRVTSREGATARDGSRPGRRRRGIASALVRVRRPNLQQALSQRVCGRWRECNQLASHSALRERRHLELPRRREPRIAVLVCVGLASAWRMRGFGEVGGCIAPEIFPSTASSRSRALPGTARRSHGSTACRALPNPRGPIRRPDSPPHLVRENLAVSRQYLAVFGSTEPLPSQREPPRSST